jgi:hypothetical protein
LISWRINGRREELLEIEEQDDSAEMGGRSTLFAGYMNDDEVRPLFGSLRGT